MEYCDNCPKLQTMIRVPDILNKNKHYAARFCMAARKNICVFEQKENEILPDIFYNFKTPEWCPRIIGKKLVSLGLGGSY
jgi:hypothetical protein